MEGHRTSAGPPLPLDLKDCGCHDSSKGVFQARRFGRNVCCLDESLDHIRLIVPAGTKEIVLADAKFLPF